MKTEQTWNAFYHVTVDTDLQTRFCEYGFSYMCFLAVGPGCPMLGCGSAGSVKLSILIQVFLWVFLSPSG